MGEAWHAEPLQGTRTRQPPTQPEARELLASAWATFRWGRPLAGPRFRRYRAECGEFVFRQRRDCPTRAKRKASLKASPRSPRNQQQPRPIANRHTGTVLRDLRSDMRAKLAS